MTCIPGAITSGFVSPISVGPVLLVHGTEDEAIPFDSSVEAQKAYANAELFPIPGDTHCYDRHLEQVLEAVKEWMEDKR